MSFVKFLKLLYNILFELRIPVSDIIRSLNAFNSAAHDIRHLSMLLVLIFVTNIMVITEVSKMHFEIDVQLHLVNCSANL